VRAPSFICSARAAFACTHLRLTQTRALPPVAAIERAREYHLRLCAACVHLHRALLRTAPLPAGFNAREHKRHLAFGGAAPLCAASSLMTPLCALRNAHVPADKRSRIVALPATFSFLPTAERALKRHCCHLLRCGMTPAGTLLRLLVNSGIKSAPIGAL